MKIRISGKSILLYLCFGAAMVLLNSAMQGVPLALGLYFSMLLCGTNLIITPILYLLASIIYLNWINSVICLFEAGFLCIVTLIYRGGKRKIKSEAIIFLAIALAPYIAFAPFDSPTTYIENIYALKGIAAGVVLLFTFFCFKTVYALLYRTMRCRLKEDELVCCAVTYVALGTGIYNLTGFLIYTSLSAGVLIFCARLAKNPSAIIASMVASIPPALVTLSPDPVTAYVIAGVFMLLFSNAGRFASGAVCGVLCATYCYFSGKFDCAPVLIVFRSLLLFAVCVLPCIPSDNYFYKLKNRLLVKEVLPDTAAYRSRRWTGEKLYRISEVFREIECAFNALDDDINEASLRSRMNLELKDKCCKRCDRAKKCEKTNVYIGFKKLIDSGCAKGKVNLIDLPSEVTINCAKPAEVLGELNLLLAEYRRFMTEAENAKSGRILLADQAHGVAEVMKGCAVELCKTYSEYSPLEETIKTALSARGISCPELFINGEDMEISAVVCGKANIKIMTDTLFETTKRRYALKDKLNYDAEKSCFIFGTPPRLDAVFGVAYAIKSGESISGDTHSVIKINEHSFLMALSDGMGSGEYAKKVSSTAISLIEAFYRAEMPEGTVLKTINKLLSFNRDERFTCIDVAAVNLNTGIANFVKIGSPAGIIMREGEIKVIESQSLPLGILDNLRPTICSEQLRSGDIVVFMSDGITSAFPSSTELYEFLQGLKPLNPQTLADRILSGAKERLKYITDDMTVLCTRIFEK